MKQRNTPPKGGENTPQAQEQKGLKGKKSASQTKTKKSSAKAKAQAPLKRGKKKPSEDAPRGMQRKSSAKAKTAQGKRLSGKKPSQSKEATPATPTLTPEERALTLYAQGQTFEEIAEAEHITEQEAVNLIKGRTEKAETLRAVAMQKYIKENQLDSKGRLEKLRNLRDSIINTLSEVNLKRVAPERLLSLYLKLNEEIREEVEHTPKDILSEQEQRIQEKERVIAQFVH